MHLINYDSLESGYLIDLLKKSGYSQEEIDASPSIIAYRQEREFRADLMAACTDIELARAFEKDFQDQIAAYPFDQNNEASWTTHPSDKVRHEKICQLISRMNAVENQA